MAEPVLNPGEIPAIDPSGSLVSIPVAQVQLAQQQGYRPPSPEEWAQYQKEQQFGGLGQQAISGLEGAASGLTFGLAPLAERAMGVPAADIRARAEVNPVTHGVGEVAGVVAPLILSGGTAAPATAAGAAARGAARLSAPSLIARAGQAAGRLAERAGVEGLAGRAIVGAASVGTEGALYGAQGAIERAAMGDPDLTAEKVAGEILVGGILGGALGAGGKVLAEMIPKGVGDRAAGWLKEFEGERNIKASGAIQSDIQRALKSKSKEQLARIGQEFQDRGLVGPLTTPADTLDRARSLASAGRSEAEDLTAAADRVGTVRFGFDDFRDTVEGPLTQQLKSKASTLKAAEQFSGEMDRLTQVYGGREMGLADVHALRRDVDALVGYGAKSLDPAIRPIAAPLRKVRQALDTMLEEGLDRTNGTGAAWREAMRKQEVAITAEKFAQKGVLRAQGNNLVSPTEFLGALGGGLGAGPVGALVTGGATALVRRHAAGTLGWVANRAQRVLLSLAERSEKSMLRDVSAIFEAGVAKAAAEEGGILLQMSNYPRAAEKIQGYASDLEQLAGATSDHTAPFDSHAPMTTAAMNLAAARAIQHLASKMPKPLARRPLDAPYHPSAPDLVKFNRHLQVTRSPLSVLQHIQKGTLSPDHMESMATVYPKLLAHARTAVLDRMAQHIAKGGKIPPITRLMLSIFLDNDLDSSMTQQHMAANQAAFARPQSPPQALGAEGLSKLTLGSRTGTPTQASSSRQEA